MRRETKRWILWVGKLLTLVVYLVFLAYAIIVGIAFVLQLLGANPTADFADWIYRAAENITQPFRGIFPPIEGDNGSVLDLSLLFAMIMYGLLALAVEWVAEWLGQRIRVETVKSAAEAAAVAPASGAYGGDRAY